MRGPDGNDILDEFRGQRCERCGEQGSEPHHILSRGAGGGHWPVNLVALCRECHNRAHSGGIEERDRLLAIVAKREAWSCGEAVWWEVWRLVRERRSAVKIIKPGRVKVEVRVWNGSCKNCGCKIECTDEEAHSGWVACPTKGCAEKIFLTLRRKTR